MLKGKTNFVVGFALGALLCGSAAVYAVGALYTPSPDGDWLRDAAVYAPGTTDQMNVLADIQPGATTLMLEVGLRFNALAAAGKKKSWGSAEHQVDEIEATFEKLAITRPEYADALHSYLTASLTPVRDAITAQDKAMFQSALGSAVSACTSCHVNIGAPFLVVKLGKSAIPIE